MKLKWIKFLAVALLTISAASVSTAFSPPQIESKCEQVFDRKSTTASVPRRLLEEDCLRRGIPLNECHDLAPIASTPRKVLEKHCRQQGIPMERCFDQRPANFSTVASVPRQVREQHCREMGIPLSECHDLAPIDQLWNPDLQAIILVMPGYKKELLECIKSGLSLDLCMSILHNAQARTGQSVMAISRDENAYKECLKTRTQEECQRLIF